MECRFIIFVCLFGYVFMPVQSKEDEIDFSKYAKMASSFLKDQNAESIGGLINNFIQGDAGKPLGDVLLNMGNQNNVNQIIQGVSSLFSQEKTGQNNNGFDPTILGNVLSFLNSMNTDDDKRSSQDSSGMLSFMGDIMQQEGGLETLMQFLPVISSTINSFTGEEAKKREEEHAEHIGVLPPFLEHIHLAYDHFMNSDLGKTLLKNLGTEKFAKAFSDSQGKFSFEKFIELIENHSFRKHWIELVTRRIAEFIAYFTDSSTQRKFSTTTQYFINSLLKTYGFPKNTMFDSARPTETLTAFFNYVFKTYLNYKVNAKEYVKPAVKYVQELVQLSQQQGYFTGKGIDSSNLSHKLADTINLEILEPGARVYRAYRFAKKNPQCDRYVICLINQPELNEKLSLPGLKRGLSMSGSMVASWFLTRHTQTSFTTLFHTVTEESNCKRYYVDSCSGFHREELKVTKQYVHNEL